MIVNPPKQIDLIELQKQLSAGGVQVDGLHAFVDIFTGLVYEVNTYDANGRLIDLPPQASTIIANYSFAPTQVQTAIQNLLTDPTYDLKSRQAFAVIVGVHPGSPQYPTV